MPLTEAEARDELAFRIAGISTSAGVAPILRRRRVGDAYGAGDASIGTVADVGRLVTVRFQLQGAVDADFIALDIPAVAGIYRIEGFRIEGVEVVDLARRAIAVHERLLEAVDASLLRFGADAGRPSLEIDVRGFEAARRDGDAGVVEVAILREDGAFELRTTLQHSVETFERLIRRQAGDHGETALAHGEELRRQGSRLADHGGRLQSLVEVQAGHTAAQADQSVALRDLRHELAQLADYVHSADDARQAQVRHLQWSFENVFWRRWLRRLRTDRT